MRFRPSTQPVLALVAFAALGCGSAPSVERAVELREGARALVVYRQADGGTTVALQNASSLPPEKAYGVGGDPNLKVIPDEQMQLLLDALATRGFFRTAQAAAVPQAKKTIRVSLDGRDYVMNWVSGLPVERYETFTYCLQDVMDVNRLNTSYHTGQRTTHDLYRQKHQVRRDTLDRYRKESRR